jgi:hypothetical protein
MPPQRDRGRSSSSADHIPNNYQLQSATSIQSGRPVYGDFHSIPEFKLVRSGEQHAT